MLKNAQIRHSQNEQNKNDTKGYSCTAKRSKPPESITVVTIVEYTKGKLLRMWMSNYNNTVGRSDGESMVRVEEVAMAI